MHHSPARRMRAHAADRVERGRPGQVLGRACHVVTRQPRTRRAGDGATAISSRKVTSAFAHPRKYPPYWCRPGRLVFHAHAAPNRMFCHGGESPRAVKIPDPMPAVGPSLRPCATGGGSAGRLAASCTGPGRRASGPPCLLPCLSTPTCTPARNSSRSAALTGTHRTASHQSGTGPVACPVLPEGPDVPAQVRTTRRATRIEFPASAGRRSR
jgi:hypothetical protein